MRFDAREAAYLQKQYCERNNLLYFAPHDGYCFFCGKNIYVPIKYPYNDLVTGYSVEYASSHLITGCPHCNRSYCD